MKLIHFVTHVLVSIRFISFCFDFILFFFFATRWARANILPMVRAACMLALKTRAEWMWLIVPKLQPYFLSARFASQKTHTKTHQRTSSGVALHA